MVGVIGPLVEGKRQLRGPLASVALFGLGAVVGASIMGVLVGLFGAGVQSLADEQVGIHGKQWGIGVAPIPQTTRCKIYGRGFVPATAQRLEVVDPLRQRCAVAFPGRGHGSPDVRKVFGWDWVMG